MGAVYLAQHEETGCRVALKTVSKLEVGRLATLRGEIAALRRLHHPSVVGIVEDGLADAVPWYAMEWVEGRVLRDWVPKRLGGHEALTVSVSSWWTSGFGDAGGEVAAHRTEANPVGVLPEGHLDGLRPLIHGLCEALGWLHEQGVLHGDLKPENILVRPDGRPVLVDFGLQRRFRNRHRETAALARVAGTAFYMAPEVIRGQLPDARADLYALGCIVYELLTGRPPFTGEHNQVLRLQLYQEPLPPSAHVSGLPPEVDVAVMRLLEKRRQDRFGYAADVARALCRGDAAIAVRPTLFLADLVGRRRELQLLQRRVDMLVDGRGGVVLLVGEAGVGKTRLALELVALARRRQVHSVSGAAWVHTSAPYAPLRPALIRLADHCRSSGAQATQALIGHRGPILAQADPALIDLPGQARGMAMGDLNEALLYALDRYGSKTGQGVLLMLDDVQWADPQTMAWLAAVASELRHVLIVCTWRDEGHTAQLQSLADADGVWRLDVGRLGPAEVGTIAGEMLALDRVPPVFATALAELTEGNALYVAEYLHVAMESGLLQRDVRGQWELAGTDLGGAADLPLPESLRALLRRRLSALSPKGRRAAEAVAIVGITVPAELVVRAAGVDEGDWPQVVHGLFGRRILEVGPVDGELQLSHGRLAEVLLGSLESASLRARQAEVASALDEWALTCFRGGEHRQALRFQRRCYALRGLCLAQDDPIRARTESGLGLIFWKLGDLDTALRFVREATDRVERTNCGTPLLQAMMWNNLALVLKNRGELVACEPIYRRAIALVEAAVGAEHIDIANLGDNLASLLLILHRSDEAQRVAERSLSLRERHYGSDSPMLAYSLNNLSAAHRNLGNYQRALDLASRAFLLRRGSLDDGHPLVARALSSLARCHLDVGEVDQALTMAMEALELGRGALGEDHPDLGTFFNTVACCLERDGDVAGALDHAQRGLRALTAGYQDNLDTAQARILVARLLRSTAPDTARELVERAHATRLRILGPE
jgi:tetratricopeptide (TPR) repeat protein